MRAVLTRVKSASVTIDGEVAGKIGRGFLILLGVGPNDTEKECRYLAEKALGLRIFEDENGKMNRSVRDIKGEILLISQFTLAADTSRGNRPGFDNAELPQKAKEMYEYFIIKLKENGISPQTGIFQAEMKVSLINDGPATFWLTK